MKETTILSHAWIILPDQAVEGSVILEQDIIADIQPQKHYREGIDLQGAWLAPGIIDIHSDYLEKELHPRPSAHFPMAFALPFMDARAASCGITTLFSALFFSDDPEKNRSAAEAVSLARELDENRHKTLVRHYLHARIDPNFPGVVDYLPDMQSLDCLQLVVFNENIPGQRQFSYDVVVRQFAERRQLSWEVARAAIDQRIQQASQHNYRKEIQAAFADAYILGSHDDTSVDHVREAKAYGATLSEMPTTLVAAREAKKLDMWVCMGAPNYYRGGSHCGNLSCHEAMEEGLVDVLCSDYHFPALIGSVAKMIEEGMPPHEAMAYVSLNPARMLGWDQQTGSIAPGKVADLIAFHAHQGTPQVSQVWVAGKLRKQMRHPEAFDPSFKG